MRATLSSEIFHGASQSGIIIFAKHAPYRWNEEEIAFARAVANLVALLLSSQKNADTLAALDLTDDGIYTEDRNGLVQYANQTAKLLAEQGPDGPIFPRPLIPLLTEHDDALGIGQCLLPGGGERDLTRAAIEQTHTETLLERRDPARHPGLRRMQALRGESEIAQLGEPDEGFEKTQIHAPILAGTHARAARIGPRPPLGTRARLARHSPGIVTVRCSRHVSVS